MGKRLANRPGVLFQMGSRFQGNVELQVALRYRLSSRGIRQWWRNTFIGRTLREAIPAVCAGARPREVILPATAAAHRCAALLTTGSGKREETLSRRIANHFIIDPPGESPDEWSMAESVDVVTRLLRAWRSGDLQARDDLVPLVYAELHRRAAAYLRRERSDHSLQPTALVNEAYLRLVAQHQVDWQNRTHFFSLAASMMRRILVDHARERHAAKRPAAGVRVTLDERLAAVQPREVDLLLLDQALSGVVDTRSAPGAGR